MAQIGNQMSKLVDKIERRLGTKALMLPKEVSKDTWPDVIIADSLDTFSRFFPRRIKVICNSSCKKDGWYHMPTSLPYCLQPSLYYMRCHRLILLNILNLKRL